MVFERPGSRSDALKWGGWSGKGVTMRVKVRLSQLANGGYLRRIMPATMILFGITVVLTILLNRAFCGWICPLGTLQMVADKVARFFKIKRFKVPQQIERPLSMLKYVILVLALYFTWKIGDLVAFHTAHKYLLLAHSPKTYKDLGQLVAAAKSVPRAELRDRYETEFMQGLAKMATAKRNVNVLHHMLGFFKKDLDKASRHELLGHIEDYRSELIPLIVPVTLIKHYVRILDVEYLRDQVYLNPHPKELALRNHV